MSGLVAAVSFPTMKELNPTIPAFSAYPTDHWTIAAGSIARRIFDIGAMTQWLLAGASAAALAVSIVAARPAHARGLPIGRIVAIVLAIGTLALWRFWLAPRMDFNLDTYWTAAKAGDIATADAHRHAFDADHPVSARMLSFIALFVLAGIGETARWLVLSARSRGEPAS